MLKRWLQQVRAEQQAAAQLQKIGAKVTYRWRPDQNISWDSSGNYKPSRWLPADGYVHSVYLHLADAERVTDVALVHLNALVHATAPVVREVDIQLLRAELERNVSNGKLVERP